MLWVNPTWASQSQHQWDGRENPKDSLLGWDKDNLARKAKLHPQAKQNKECIDFFQSATDV